MVVFSLLLASEYGICLSRSLSLPLFIWYGLVKMEALPITHTSKQTTNVDQMTARGKKSHVEVLFFN